ncbi:hypothetical protein Tco_0688889 [Tanacetum coccineum]
MVSLDTVLPTQYMEATHKRQPPVVQVETQVPNSKPVVAPVVEPVEAPVSASKHITPEKRQFPYTCLGFSREWQIPLIYRKQIVSTSFPTLTPFGDSDFLLEETDAFLTIEDELISPEIDDSYYDSEGDILLRDDFF